MKGIETFFCFKVCEMIRAILNNYVRRNLAYSSLDENGNYIYTVVKGKKFYKVPYENVKVWFPEEYYKKGELKGCFQRLKKVGPKFYAVYKILGSEEEFEVNKKLKILKVNSEE